jgi:hypothetical protein
MLKPSRFGFCRYTQPPGRSRPITLGQGMVWDILAANVGKLLSASVPRTFDEINGRAESVARRFGVEPVSREQLALELVTLIEHGLVHVERMRAE